jgi:DNA-3-methyladenine glycosylase II
VPASTPSAAASRSWLDDLAPGARRMREVRGAEALAAADPAIARVIRATGRPRRLGRGASFDLLARSIVYQQLSGKAATAIWNRLIALVGTLEPATLLRRRDATLRGVGLSWAKVAALKDLARHVADGRIDPAGLSRLSDEEVVASVTRVRGIGVWSAQMHLIFSLGRMDVWPSADLGVRKALARLHGLPALPTFEEAERLGEPWRPWRTMAAWYLWRLLDAPAEEGSAWE